MNINTKLAISKRIYQKAIDNKVPILGTFELTPGCNMNCKMCYVHVSDYDRHNISVERTSQEWIKTGQECRDAGMLFLLLTGGEPFFRKDFKEIYIGLNNLGLIITINTNGLLITEDTLEWLKKCPPSKMNISIYGTSDETYEKICGIKNGFSKVTRVIDMLLAANIRIGINATIIKDNFCDLEGIYSFAKERHLSVKETVYMFPPFKSNERKIIDYQLTPEEAGYALFFGKKYQMSEEMFKIYIERMKDVLSNAHNNININSDGCMAGKASFSVTWDGKIKACGMISEQMGDLAKDDFLTCWNRIISNTKGRQLPNVCRCCNKRSYCTICNAVINAECKNNTEAAPGYMCKITESYIGECIKYISD